MVYYNDQNLDLNKKIEEIQSILINMKINEDDINFIIQSIETTPIAIGCKFIIGSLINRNNPIYEINLSQLKFHDHSLKGTIQIMQTNEFKLLAKLISKSLNEKMENILIPDNYYIRFG